MELLTSRQTAELLEVPIDTLQAWVRRGYLASTRDERGRHRFDPALIGAMARLIPPRIMTLRAAASLAGCSYSTVCREIQAGCLKAVRLVPGPKVPYLIDYDEGVAWARMWRDDPHHNFHRARLASAAA